MKDLAKNPRLEVVPGFLVEIVMKSMKHGYILFIATFANSLSSVAGLYVTTMRIRP
jgi:hypothetical protein